MTPSKAIPVSETQNSKHSLAELGLCPEPSHSDLASMLIMKGWKQTPWEETVGFLQGRHYSALNCGLFIVRVKSIGDSQLFLRGPRFSGEMTRRSRGGGLSEVETQEDQVGGWAGRNDGWGGSYLLFITWPVIVDTHL